MTLSVDETQNTILRTPVVEVTVDDGSYTVDTNYLDERTKSVAIAAGAGLVQLPNGHAYRGGDTALLTPFEAAQISDAIVDNGWVTITDVEDEGGGESL